MFQLQKVLLPETVEEAYAALMEKRNNAVLGGCAFMKMGSKAIPVGIDLSRLGLDTIREQDGIVEVGAMATLRDVETSLLLKGCFGGMVPKALRSIIGVQFRNTVTVGGSVFSRFGFSDFNTALLALDAEVVLHKGGRMPLEAFLEKPSEKDILLKVLIRKNGARAAYGCIRRSFSDYPVLNVAVSEAEGQWRIAVGARPMAARIARAASARLSTADAVAAAVDEAADLAAEELAYGGNMRASAEYRQAMSRVLVKRAVMEVLECR